MHQTASAVFCKVYPNNTRLFAHTLSLRHSLAHSPSLMRLLRHLSLHLSLGTCTAIQDPATTTWDPTMGKYVASYGGVVTSCKIARGAAYAWTCDEEACPSSSDTASTAPPPPPPPVARWLSPPATECSGKPVFPTAGMPPLTAAQKGDICSKCKQYSGGTCSVDWCATHHCCRTSLEAMCA